MTTDTLIIDAEVNSDSPQPTELAGSSNSLGEVASTADPDVLDKKASYASLLEDSSPLVSFPSEGIDHCDNKKVFQLSQLCRDLIELTKPRIVIMILVTTIATALIGAGQALGMPALIWLLMGTGLIAASAGTANQVWERQIDKRMTRTADRPLAAARLPSRVGSIFAGVLGIAGSVILFSKFSATPAMVGAATWLLYVLVYTPMKTRTAWNTSVGAVAGALPMLMGYTAAGGELTDATGWLLVGILAAWQYPHFMAIAWMYRKQYAEAGFQMSTTVDPTGKSAGIQSVMGSILLIGCACALCWMRSTITGAGIASICTLVVSWPMLNASIKFLRSPDDQIARLLLRKSLVVLPLVLAIVTATLLG